MISKIKDNPRVSIFTALLILAIFVVAKEGLRPVAELPPIKYGAALFEGESKFVINEDSSLTASEKFTFFGTETNLPIMGFAREVDLSGFGDGASVTLESASILNMKSLAGGVIPTTNGILLIARSEAEMQNQNINIDYNYTISNALFISGKKLILNLNLGKAFEGLAIRKRKITIISPASFGSSYIMVPETLGSDASRLTIGASEDKIEISYEEALKNPDASITIEWLPQKGVITPPVSE